MRRATATVFACLIAQTSVTSAVQVSQQTLDFDGQSRGYVLVQPDDPSRVRALVIALHPALSSGVDFSESSGWSDLAEEEALAIAFPNGGNLVNAAAQRYTWNSYVFDGSGPDDLGFLSALLGTLGERFALQAGRSFMTGFSNGAMMTNTFACSRALEVAAIAPVSGGWMTAYGTSESACQPARPIPVWIWRGGNENFTTGSPPTSRSVQDQQQLSFWRQINSAQGMGQALSVQIDVLGRTYTHLDERFPGATPVRFTEVSNSSHVYQPGAATRIWSEWFKPLVQLFQSGFEAP